MRTLEDVVKTVSRVLGDLDMDYVIVGGIAIAGWGNVRTTRDVDIIMDVREKDVPALRAALVREGFDVTGEDIRDALKEGTHFTVFDTRSDYHIDAKGCYGKGEMVEGHRSGG